MILIEYSRGAEFKNNVFMVLALFVLISEVCWRVKMPSSRVGWLFEILFGLSENNQNKHVNVYNIST